jgi:hypothetical protein
MATSINSVLQDITSNAHSPQSGKLKLDSEGHTIDAQYKSGILCHFHWNPFQIHLKPFPQKLLFEIRVESRWRYVGGV